jgi:hypothetical protein
MNSDSFTANILAPREQKKFPTGRRPHAKRLTFHLDQCNFEINSSQGLSSGYLMNARREWRNESHATANTFKYQNPKMQKLA